MVFARLCALVLSVLSRDVLHPLLGLFFVILINASSGGELHPLLQSFSFLSEKKEKRDTLFLLNHRLLFVVFLLLFETFVGLVWFVTYFNAYDNILSRCPATVLQLLSFLLIHTIQFIFTSNDIFFILKKEFIFSTFASFFVFSIFLAVGYWG